MNQHPQSKAAVLATAIVLILVGIAAPPAAATTTSCNNNPVGTGTCTFQSGTIQGTYTWPTMIVPSGVTLHVNGAVELRAAILLDVAGTIHGGDLIKLNSAGTIKIAGTVKAANGIQGGSAYVTAANGYVGLTGLLAAGDGSPGASATLAVDGPLGPVAGATTRAAVAEPGGQGGDVVIQAGAFLDNGLVHVGNGGDGGSAVAAGPSGVLPGGSLLLVATAGAGGRSGTLTLPPGDDPVSLYFAGKIDGGVGGNGGNANACAGVTVGTCGSYGANSSVAPPPACDGASYTDSHNVQGGDGCDGADVTATGGDGGIGLFRGGHGGWAVASGQSGGRGGDGSNAGACWKFGSYPSGCAHDTWWDARAGGKGGDGGTATANGGNGGDSLLRGGDAGFAVAYGGNAGASGNGGRGYGQQVSQNYWVDTCYGDQDCYHVVKPGTYTRYYYLCLVPGAGGPAATGGYGQAKAGQGGTAVLAPAGLGHNGHGSWAWQWSGYAGYQGWDGDMDYSFCDPVPFYHAYDDPSS